MMQTHRTQITEHDLASPWPVLDLLDFHSPISTPSSSIWPRCGSHEVEREREVAEEVRREKKYYIKWLIFGSWMNSGSTSWVSYCRKWSSGLKFEEVGVGVFCGFRVFTSNILKFFQILKEKVTFFFLFIYFTCSHLKYTLHLTFYLSNTF